MEISPKEGVFLLEGPGKKETRNVHKIFCDENRYSGKIKRKNQAILGIPFLRNQNNNIPVRWKQRKLCKMNIPGQFPSAVRWYGNHFLDSLLCIPNHNFYENISKGCYAPQMRQGLDKYSHRNATVIKHKKGEFRVPELRFPNFRICDFELQEYSTCILYSKTTLGNW